MSENMFTLVDNCKMNSSLAFSPGGTELLVLMSNGNVKLNGKLYTLEQQDKEMALELIRTMSQAYGILK